MPTSSDHPTPDYSSPDLPLEDPVPDGLGRISRLNLAFLCLSILSICSAVYLSPIGSSVRDTVGDTVRSAVPAISGLTGSGTPSASATTTASAAPTSVPSAVGHAGASSSTSTAAETDASTPSSATLDDHLFSGATPSAAPPRSVPVTSAGSSGSTSSSTAKTKCWEFAWQQDAQAVYVANLSDPYGLDAGVGPADGDGLACSDLKVDPTRAASTPVGAYVPPKPSVATKAELVSPARDYFGFSEDGVPGDTSLMKSLAVRAGKAPSTVGWFSSFDDSYRADLVEKAWDSGALPVISWQPVDSGSGTSYSLTSIINGSHDAYLRRFAGDVVREDLPVALRFAHEMNGNWYGWSAGQTDWNNSPAKYIAAWRHVWQVFDEVGATDDVIWLWSPNRVDDLNPTATNGLTAMADDYPGDAYVDWVGASVYLRNVDTGPTYAASFGKTVAALEQVTDKPIFFGETAAVQSSGGVDETALKASWTANVLPRLAADPRIVGWLWFNNQKATVVNGVEVTNDWRFDSSTAARDAFRAAVAGDGYASGVMPD